MALQQHSQERLRCGCLHTTIDVTWQLFPIRGSYWDPRVNGAIIAIAAVVVVKFGATNFG